MLQFKSAKNDVSKYIHWGYCFKLWGKFLVLIFQIFTDLQRRLHLSSVASYYDLRLTSRALRRLRFRETSRSPSGLARLPRLHKANILICMRPNLTSSPRPSTQVADVFVDPLDHENNERTDLSADTCKQAADRHRLLLSLHWRCIVLRTATNWQVDMRACVCVCAGDGGEDHKTTCLVYCRGRM